MPTVSLEIIGLGYGIALVIGVLGGIGAGIYLYRQSAVEQFT